MVVHFKHYCNTYGSLSAYIVAFLLRLSGGEALLGLPALIEYPGYDADKKRQLFPFRTMAMLCSLITLAGVSYYTKWVFESGRLPPQYDYFKCVVNIPDDAVRVGDLSETGEQVRVLEGYDYSMPYKHAHEDSFADDWTSKCVCCVRHCQNASQLKCVFSFSAISHGWSNGQNVWCGYNGWQRRNEWTY